MTLRKTRTENIWWQDCQYTGIRPGHPTSTVYDFDTEFANGSKGGQWIWEREYNENLFRIEQRKSDGVWTEIEDAATAAAAAAAAAATGPTTPEYS